MVERLFKDIWHRISGVNSSQELPALNEETGNKVVLYLPCDAARLKRPNAYGVKILSSQGELETVVRYSNNAILTLPVIPQEMRTVKKEDTIIVQFRGANGPISRVAGEINKSDWRFYQVIDPQNFRQYFIIGENEQGLEMIPHDLDRVRIHRDGQMVYIPYLQDPKQEPLEGSVDYMTVVNQHSSLLNY